MENHQRKILGANIRHLRKVKGLSQEQLADDAGIHRTYIGAVERGERNVSLDNIVAIARGLKVRASELLEGIE
jgi:transcriptional regulator with XRE-family HTH domain